ncbi:hypothetical protein [Allosphingosinicella indica]|uniref:Lipoprotein n=1 Tax=Allosphingosinicella indica TaxID=941907 RepID=A0A1X7GIW3_9SPHN|nr:hypothetical protein [Allosphingosinicella indica]SMF70499.1 hypothetical protein SAMN06295910_1886 [Allosphingosinicella indica]
MRYLAMTVLLAGCSTAQLSENQATATYPSAKSRAEIGECLLNRMSGSMSRVRIERAERSDSVVVDGPLGNPVMVFLIKDAETGSITELRRMSSLTSGKGNAETCF